MTTLPGSYMAHCPTELRVTILDTPEDLLWFHLDGGILEDADGNVVLARPAGAVIVPLKGLYRVQCLENGTPVAGPGKLMTKEMFEADFTEHAAPYFEYGVWTYYPRRHGVVLHGSLEAAQEALDAEPVLKASGDYRIVRRLTHEENDWELLAD